MTTITNIDWSGLIFAFILTFFTLSYFHFMIENDNKMLEISECMSEFTGLTTEQARQDAYQYCSENQE